jgi:hypothetical protein
MYGIYILTIGNPSSKIYQMPWMHSVVTVTHLLIPIMNCSIPQEELNEQWKTNWDVLNKVLWWVLQLLAFKQNPSTKYGYYNVLCADGNLRRSKLVLAAWRPDYPKQSDLHQLEQHVCLWCECLKNDHWENLPPHKQHRLGDRNQYRILSDANPNAANAELLSHIVKLRIQRVSTYSVYHEQPPEARPPKYNADRHAWPRPAVDFPLTVDTGAVGQVECDLVTSGCLPWLHSKQ